jgi:hypothetical protein
LPTSNAATRWMIWSLSCVSSSTPASLCSDDPTVVARRSHRATGESDPRAQGDTEGPKARLPAPGLSTASNDQGDPASAGNRPDFTQERAPPQGGTEAYQAYLRHVFVLLERETPARRWDRSGRGCPLDTGVVRPGYAGFVGHRLLVSINTTRARPWGNVGGRGHRRVRGPYGSSPDRHLPVCGGAAGSCTVTRSPPAGRGVRVRVPSCAWVMLLTIARPRPTPAWSVRMRSVPR